MEIRKNSSEIFNLAEIKEISEFFDLPEFAVEYLFSRGIRDKQQISKFINPTLGDLHDPFLLSGMREAVERTQKAINNKETILVYGDYDVDGISATTILYRYLKNCNADVKYFIPSRNDDGYGLNIETLKHVISKFKPNLIITVDCGISCYDEVNFLKENGVDCIVTDHHDIPEKVPNTIVVNAKLPNQNYPFRELCGTGVAFKFVCALSGKILEVFLPIVAIATIADIVPLVDENRVLTYLGLKLWEQYAPYGIKKLCASLDLTTLNAQEISMKVAPRINAPGRLGSPIDAVNLYLEKNETEIDRIIQKITEINNQRKDYCTVVVNDVKKMLNSINLNENYAIVLKNENWEAGILGIACARISEEYCRPTFLFSKIGNVLKGSGRSFGKINISKAISECSEHLIQFGGHSAAVGLELEKENFYNFATALNNNIKANYSSIEFTPVKNYDIDLQANMLTLSNMQKLNKLEPFGFGNPRPQYKVTLNKSELKYVNLIKDAHLVIKHGKLDAIGFNMPEQLKLIKNSESADFVIDAQINEYNGKKSVKCKINAVKVNNFKFDSSYYNEFLYTLENFEHNQNKRLGKYVSLNNENVQEMLTKLQGNPFGNVFLCSTQKGYKRFEQLKAFIKVNNIEFNEVLNKSLINSLVYQPQIDKLQGYKNYILLDDLYSLNYFSKLDKENKNFFYFECERNVSTSIVNVSTDREVFKNYFHAIKQTLEKRKIFANLIDMFFFFQKVNPQLRTNFMQFSFCFKVFLELSIFVQEDTPKGIKFNLTKNNSSLEKSVLYQNIQKR